MGQKLIVGPINKGLRKDRTAFVIDNDSFPTLINAYQWRGRVKRKRGTQLLGRLQRIIGTTDGLGDLIVTIDPIPIASGIVSFTIGADVFVDGGGASPVNLTTNSSGTGVLNRATGVLTITGSQINTNVVYFPTLPVMGLEDFVIETNAFPGTIAFDTTYAYNILTVEPYSIYDVSFYKNPASGTPVTYVQKTNWTPVTWKGRDYQQFWTVNYQGALWTTNGITVPFSPTNIGMQFQTPVTATQTSATTVDFVIVGSPLVIGDFVFANEFTGASGDTLNFQTGYVTAIPVPGTYTVTFPNATIGAAGLTPGILQYLTTRVDLTKDCIRWYDGDPTNGSIVTPGFTPGKGWVNFTPPLSQGNFSIANLPAAKYYLVGARMIIPFKDRLLFIGPVVQTSAAGSQRYLQDTVIFSQNGTPYYTASFTGTPISPTTGPLQAGFLQLLVPLDQTATASAYWEDQTGFGGFAKAGIDQPINTASANDDVLIMGLDTTQARLIYTNSDLIPFVFYIINSELGSSSPFSAINLDRGVITRGSRGYIITSQTEAKRFDLDIPEQVFEVNLLNNGSERICAQRDYINEWVYFTYPTNQINDNAESPNPLNNPFPNQTLLYNYRDHSWAIFNETYTTYGQFKKQTGFTWATVGQTYPTWSEWNDPWDAGESTLLQPDVIAGNQQGFVLVRDAGTGEGKSLTIQGISGSIVTSPNHGLNIGDFIIISDALGTVGAEVNGKVFKVEPITTNTITLNPALGAGPFTYLGGGLIKRLYNPFIQTKQFPAAWEMSRKTRLGVQQYLLTKTSNAQITVLIYLSQDDSNPYNDSPVVPLIDTTNNSLIYSTIVYTCPESTNLGLTPANTNLQQLTQISSNGQSSNNQAQIWHRVNTSLIGDTVQLGFTMNDKQMRDLDDNGLPISQFAEIELHGFVIDLSPSQMLS